MHTNGPSRPARSPTRWNCSIGQFNFEFPSSLSLPPERSANEVEAGDEANEEVNEEVNEEANEEDPRISRILFTVTRLLSFSFKWMCTFALKFCSVAADHIDIYSSKAIRLWWIMRSGKLCTVKSNSTHRHSLPKFCNLPNFPNPPYYLYQSCNERELER